MNIKKLEWVLDSDLNYAQKMLIVALFKYTNKLDQCYPAIKKAARDAGMSESMFRRVALSLRRLGVIEIEERRPTGKRQTTNLYTVRTDWKRSATGALMGVRLNGGGCQDDRAINPTEGVRLTPLLTIEQKNNEGDLCKSPSGFPDFEDDRIAREMFALIVKINPDHKEPDFKRWANDVRLMRTRDKRTHQEIAALFAWANLHAFWRVSILSPAKLRDKWDQLQLQRIADATMPTKAASKPAAAADHQCAWRKGHADRCAAPGVASTGGHTSSPWWCSVHLDAVEQRNNEELSEASA